MGCSSSSTALSTAVCRFEGWANARHWVSSDLQEPGLVRKEMFAFSNCNLTCTKHYQQSTVSAALSAQHCQRRTISTAQSAQRSQRGTVSTVLAAQHCQHSTVSTTLSAQHCQHIEVAAITSPSLHCAASLSNCLLSWNALLLATVRPFFLVSAFCFAGCQPLLGLLPAECGRTAAAFGVAFVPLMEADSIR